MSKEKMHAVHGGKLARYGMWTCCAVMLIPVAGLLLSGSARAGMSPLTAFAPLVLCGGVHLVMHKMMGKSCHSGGEANKAPEPVIVVSGRRAGKQAIAVE